MANNPSPQLPDWSLALTETMTELKSKDSETRTRAAKTLRGFVLGQTREMTGEAFSKFLNDLHTNIFDLVNSSNTTDKIGGLLAIDQLVDIDYDENATKITRLSNLLRISLATTDLTVMHLASKALGRLARTGGTHTAECVEFEVGRALEWLQRERYEARRHAAVLILKELASNAPTLFTLHVPAFLDLVWVALRDPKLVVRTGAAEALHAVLELIAERDNKLRQQWYQKIYDEIQLGFKANQVEHIHGSLLAICELLQNSGEFLDPPNTFGAKFKEVCESILKYRDHRDRVIKKAVIQVLPVAAMFNSEVFCEQYLANCIAYLLACLKTPERPAAFTAIGGIASAVKADILPSLENIVVQVKGGLAPRTRCAEALPVVPLLAEAVPEAFRPYLDDLLDLMFEAGLSDGLVRALTALTRQPLPAHLSLADLQKRLLALISDVLRRPRTPEDPAPVQLALHTLSTFDFTGHPLSDFVREVVVPFLDDDNTAIRKEAVIACLNLIVAPNQIAPTQGHAALVIGEVLEKLLMVGIADPDPAMRKTVLAALLTPLTFCQTCNEWETDAENRANHGAEK